DPIMLEISPVTVDGVAMNGPDMIMGPDHRTGEALENKTESTRRHVEPAWLEPDAVGVGNPPTVIGQVRVRDEVSAAPSVRLKAIGRTAKGDDRHRPSS